MWKNREITEGTHRDRGTKKLGQEHHHSPLHTPGNT